MQKQLKKKKETKEKEGNKKAEFKAPVDKSGKVISDVDELLAKSAKAIEKQKKKEEVKHCGCW